MPGLTFKILWKKRQGSLQFSSSLLDKWPLLECDLSIHTNNGLTELDWANGDMVNGLSVSSALRRDLIRRKRLRPSSAFSGLVLTLAVADFRQAGLSRVDASVRPFIERNKKKQTTHNF